MAGFVYKLQFILFCGSNSSEEALAKALLKNIKNMRESTTINELAKLCYTSPSTLSRFSTKLGYKSFDQMRCDYLGIKNEFEDLKVDNSVLDNLPFSQYIDTITTAIQNLDSRHLIDNIQLLIELITSHNNVYFFATHIPGDLTSIIQRAILTSGKYVEFLPDKHLQVSLIKSIKEGDLCIFISMEGTLVMEKALTIPVLKSSATTILITQNPFMKFADQFTHIVPLGYQDDSFSAKFKLMVFVDLFIHQYYKYIETYGK